MNALLIKTVHAMESVSDDAIKFLNAPRDHVFDYIYSMFEFQRHTNIVIVLGRC